MDARITTPRRFLFVMIEGGGTVPPELGLARQLVARGHTVRVLADDSIADDARAAGCAFVPYVRAPNRPNRRPETALVKDWEIRNPLAFMLVARNFLFGTARAYAEDVLNALEREPADALAIEWALLGAIAAAEKAGLPTALLMPNCYILPAPGLPAIGPGFLPARTPVGRARDALVGALVTWFFGTGGPLFNATRARLGLPPLEHPFAQIEQAERLLVLTSPAFDFPARALPSNVRYVGPQLDDPAWAPPWESPWPAAHPDPLVVAGFSSTYQDQGPVLQKVIDALGGMRVRGLVTVGPALDAQRFHAPANVVVRDAAPHSAVFPQAAAVVTHAGHGTVIRALAYGAPLVCLPMGRDQNDNAARVVARGAGLRLSPRAPAPALRAAVQRVLDDPPFRTNARLLATAIAAETRRAQAVAELEELATRGS